MHAGERARQISLLLFLFLSSPHNGSNVCHRNCGNCVKHGVACDFSSSPSMIFSPSVVTPTYQDNVNMKSPSPVSNSTIIPYHKPPLEELRIKVNLEASRSLELKLMHNYTAFTAETFAYTREERLAWQRNVPILAYEAQYDCPALLLY